MLVTDVHVHIFEPDTPEHPWPHESGRSSGTAKHPGFSAEEMIGAMGAVGVDRAVIVPPVWAGENNAPAIAAVERHPGRFAIMGRFDPYAPGAEERLERWLEQPGMLGIRMSGRWSTTPAPVSEAIEDAGLEWYWAACERLGIRIAFLAGQFLPKLAPIAERHPELRMLIDHLGTRGATSTAGAFSTVDDLEALSKYPNVYMKAGTAPNCSSEAYPFTDVHPHVRRIYDAFGARRMMWEADITQLGTKNTYAECIRLWQEGLPFLSSEDRDWILGGTAAEVLNWPEGTER